MNSFEIIERIKRLDYFLRSKCTGNSSELAKKLGVCRRTVFDDMDIIRSKGADIYYSKISRTYYYQKEFKLIF